MKFGFIGLGLIGGSIAKAVKENINDSVIVAYDINQNTLEMAKNENVADITTASIDDSFRDCDYIFLCAPVQKNDENVEIVKQIISPKCILTDVGSVKTEINNAIYAAGLEEYFIGGHPMAGSERMGFINSKAVLLENAYYILTPTSEVSDEKIEKYKELVSSLGALPLVLTCSQHDYVTAAVSHVPHVIASSLVNMVKDNDSENEIMKMIAAGGFKDITRIASSSADVWQEICLSNSENIVSFLDEYIKSLTEFKNAISCHDQDGIFNRFDGARIYRDSFTNIPRGPLKSSHSISVDIADEPGALASITVFLASNAISIKNIGISHNREFEGGILRIEFYDENTKLKAIDILRNKNYSAYDTVKP